jgi:2-polyprenyl-6-methoxyphenol hydroxylase-like FAD-dependent oxidoreductase
VEVSKKKVLICGAGIAGPTLAWWLHHFGFNPSIVEVAIFPATEEDRRAMLRSRFAGLGWECERMLEALDSATDLYVDSISQIHLPRWSDGRIALVGDAAWAPSLLAGEGCGLGIMGGYTLAGELALSGFKDDIQLPDYDVGSEPLLSPATHMSVGSMLPAPTGSRILSKTMQPSRE